MTVGRKPKYTEPSKMVTITRMIPESKVKDFKDKINEITDGYVKAEKK